MKRFERKTVLVTGGTGGVGIAAARAFAAEVASVIVTGRGEDALNTAKAAIGLAVSRTPTENRIRAFISSGSRHIESLIKLVMFILVVVTFAAVTPATAQTIESKVEDVNGVKLHYLIAGKGSPVVLLHGYTQTSRMWLPLIKELSRNHVVIAPDLRGFGGSSHPEGPYTKVIMADDVHALTQKLAFGPVRVVGHDIGLMVAYAYAAKYPGDVERIALMDAFLPGVGDWKQVWLLRDLWHFHFYGKTAEGLVAGRERVYFEHFWNDFAADPKHSIPEADRQFYTDAYAQPGRMRSGFEVFRAFEQDAIDFAALGHTKLQMPMLVLTGEKASGEFLINQARMVANNVEGIVVKGSGHWLMEEATSQVVPKLVEFLNHGG